MPVPKCRQHGEQTGGIEPLSLDLLWDCILVWNGSQDESATGDGHRLFRKARLRR